MLTPTALSRLGAEVGAPAPLSVDAVRAVRAGAKRIRDVALTALADAALRELLGGMEIPMSETKTPTDEDAVHCMRQFGGSFIKRLADAWLAADITNKARLKLAFEPEFDRYREHAARAAKGPAHYVELARQAAERTGEEVLPEHQPRWIGYDGVQYASEDEAVRSTGRAYDANARTV